MLELCRIQSTASLSLIPVPLWPGVVAPDRVLFMGQIRVPTLNRIVSNKTVFDI